MEAGKCSFHFGQAVQQKKKKNKTGGLLSGEEENSKQFVPWVGRIWQYPDLMGDFISLICQELLQGKLTKEKVVKYFAFFPMNYIASETHEFLSWMRVCVYMYIYLFKYICSLALEISERTLRSLLKMTKVGPCNSCEEEGGFTYHFISSYKIKCTYHVYILTFPL